MAEQSVRIEGTVPVSTTGTQNVAITGVGAAAGNPLYVTDSPPGNLNFYLYAVADVPGTVAANNYLSVFNPVGSGKTVTFYRAIVSSYATGVTSSAVSAQLVRTTAASAGTLAAASTVPRLITSEPNPVAEVRSGNPTVTAAAVPLISFAPPLTTSKGGGSALESVIPAGGNFVCQPGEGLVVRQTASETAQLWSVQFLWSEA